MRIGVNTGKVFTGDFGPPYRRAYRVFGDAINTAARVMSKAEPGQILSTEIVLERSRTMFQTTADRAVRGQRESRAGSSVRRRPHRRIARPSSRRRPARPGPGARGAARRVVDDARRSQLDRRGHGEAGTGSTRLIERSSGDRAGCRVFHAGCEEYESATPYFPLRAPSQVSGSRRTGRHPGRRTAAEAVERLDPSLAPLAAAAGGPARPRLFRRRRETARSTSASCVTGSPRYRAVPGTVARWHAAIFVVEDVQHMDEASRRPAPPGRGRREPTGVLVISR